MKHFTPNTGDVLVCYYVKGCSPSKIRQVFGIGRTKNHFWILECVSLERDFVLIAIGIAFILG